MMEKQTEKELKPVKINVSIQAEINISIESLAQVKSETDDHFAMPVSRESEEEDILIDEVLRALWEMVLTSAEIEKDWRGDLIFRPGEIAEAINKKFDTEKVSARKVGSVFRNELSLYGNRKKSGFYYCLSIEYLLDLLAMVGIDWEGDLRKILQSEQREHMAGELKSLMQRYVAGELFEADEQGS